MTNNPSKSVNLCRKKFYDFVTYLCPMNQIYKVMNEISRYCNIKLQLLVGGKPIQEDKKLLKENPHIIIGTPGRVYDMIVRNHLITNNIKRVVTEEGAERIQDAYDGEIIEINRYAAF